MCLIQVTLFLFFRLADFEDLVSETVGISSLVDAWHVHQFILHKTHTITQKETEIEQNLEKIWTFI